MRLESPFIAGWALSVGTGKNDSNSHGEVISREPYKRATLRSTWLLVPLGRTGNLMGIRSTWGRRLWFYRADGSCWYVQAYVCSKRARDAAEAAYAAWFKDEERKRAAEPAHPAA